MAEYQFHRCQLLDGAVTYADRSYTRGDALNITGITDNVTGSLSQSFIYSATNRLAAATGPYGSYSWSYDLVGNRTSEGVTPPGGTLSTDAYAYPATSNRVQTITRGASTVRQITYDNAGNILTDNRLGTTYTYTYNSRNRLAGVPAGGWCPEFFALLILAERRPAGAQAVIGAGWAFRNSIDKYRFVDHSLPAMWRSRAAARFKALSPSGKAPTTRVRRLISRSMRSSGLLVLIRRQCSSGNL